MKVETLFSAAGVAWGLLFGLAGATYAGGLAAGFAWLFLFGDDTWPAWAEYLILAVAVAIGIAIFVGCVALGRLAGRRIEPADPSSGRRARALAVGLLVLAFLTVVGELWGVARQDAEIDRQRQGQRTAEAVYARMLADTHRFTAIDVQWPGDGANGKATLQIEGGRAGIYSLEWYIRARSVGKSLLSGDRQLELQPGPSRVEFTIPPDALVDGYRGMLSRQNANVMVDEPFMIEVSLTPILEDDELAALPRGEARNLDQGWSKLVDKARVEFPVRFFLYDGELSWERR